MVSVDSDSAARPKTNVGLWLEATLRRDDAEAERLLLTLNEGKQGWNDQEPGVVEAACDISVQRLFAMPPDSRMLNDFATEIHRKTAPSDPLEILTVSNLEGAVRHSLDSSYPLAGLSQQRETILRLTIVGECVRMLNLRPEENTELVVAAESLAIRRGYSPPLVL